MPTCANMRCGARCGCCALLRNEPGDRLEWVERFVPGHRYPEAYRVALDIETAIVVSTAPIGETDLDGLEPWSVRIHEVDGPDPFGATGLSPRR